MRLSGRAEVDRTPAEVFAFVADASNNPRWQQGQRSCEWITPPPMGVGSRYRQVARFLGRDVESLFEVVDLVPGESITISSIAGSFPITVRRSVRSRDGGGSVVTAEIQGEPGRFFRLLGPLLRPLAQRSVSADYRRLKQLLEASGEA
jgi:hypothetical protein